MKKILLYWALGLVSAMSYGQVIYSENFSNVNPKSVPAGWTVTHNTNADHYQRPFDCITDTGFVTPAVGQGAPSRFILPVMAFDATNNILKIRFKVFVLDANLTCASAKNFPCTTYVTVMLVKPAVNDVAHLPDAADIISQQSYRIAIANGDNTIIFNNPALAQGAQYRIYFDFKTAEGTGCTSSGTKFIFDDFLVDKTSCINCTPVAHDDYFDGSRQNFFNTMSGNVYGGFALWASQAPAGFELKSLSNPPAVEDGLDYDANNHDLSLMQFQLISSPEVISTGTCSATPGNGTLTWNNNGTFTYTRSDPCVKRISFTYRIIDPTLLASDTATVTIDFTLYFPLAVNFTSFTAERDGRNVMLNWKTSGERNCRGFYVQRNHGNGWINRTFVPSAAKDGNSDLPLSYNYRDMNDYGGLTQYRIAQLDQNGSYSYSSIVIISDNLAEMVQVYPNPSGTGNINVVLPSSNNAFDLQLLDEQGRKLTEWKRVNETLFTIDNLHNGLYFLRVTECNSAKTTTVRLVIAR